MYGTLFPQNVRRMVLDSNVDPRGVWYGDNLDQDVAFDKNILIWFGWVAQHDDVYHLGKTQSAVQRAWSTSSCSRRQCNPAGGVIGPDEIIDVIQQASYYQLRGRCWATRFAVRQQG